MFHVRWRAVIAILAFAAAGGGTAQVRADLTIEIVDPDAGAIQVLDNFALDTNREIGVIDVNTGLLNQSLVNFSFTSLRATSNSPAGASRPVISLSGTVTRVADAGVKSTVTVRVTDVDFNYAGTTRLRTSATALFQNTGAGDRFVSQSFLDPNDVLFGTTVSGARLADAPKTDPTGSVPSALSQDARPTRFKALTIPYSLTSQVDITLGVSALTSEPRTVQFAMATSATGS
jgi:hypothetical protein